VTLGSLRVRQDFLIAESLLAPYEKGKPVSPKMQEMALARLSSWQRTKWAHAGTDAQLFGEHGQPLFGDGLSAAVREACGRWHTGFVRGVRDGNRGVGQGIHRIWLSGFCSGDERRSSAEQILLDAFGRGCAT